MIDVNIKVPDGMVMYLKPQNQHMDLIHRLFGEIQIPEAVLEELVSNKRFPEESRQIRESSYNPKNKVENPKNNRIKHRENT
jgi:predicted nucleic acid-binding protein